LNETQKWIGHIQRAQQVLDGLDIDERNRDTLRRCLAESLVRAEDSEMSAYSRRNEGRPWAKDELLTLEKTLSEADDCMTYGQEQIALAMMSERFGRAGKIIKTKAIELGFGSKLDWYSNNPRD
jgi:hypothetical protein